MLFIECHNDAAVVTALGVPRRAYLHRDGKSRVAKALTKASAGSVGMIDEDPHDHSKIPDFSSYVIEKRFSSFDLLFSKAQNKSLIRIRPRIEEWLVKAAEDVNVRLSHFHLPEGASQLHLLRPESAGRIRDLIAELKQKNSKPILDLEKILRERCV
jgi:hypothetical protein